MKYILLTVIITAIFLSACTKGRQDILGGCVHDEYSHLSEDSLTKLGLIRFHYDTLVAYRGFERSIGRGRGPYAIHGDIQPGDTIVIKEKYGAAICGWSSDVYKLGQQ